MAPLWALRGDGEGELQGKLTRADVVHDDSKQVGPCCSPWWLPTLCGYQLTHLYLNSLGVHL